MQEISQIISSIGFPIVFCLLMWRYISSQNEQLRQVISQFQVTMSENNRLLTTLCTKLDVDTGVKHSA